MILNFKTVSLLEFLLLIFKSWDSKLRFILSHYSVGKKGCHMMPPTSNVFMNAVHTPVSLVPANWGYLPWNTGTDSS